MKQMGSPDQVQRMTAVLRTSGKRVGLVPTMGCFHEGHLSLIRAARQETDVVVVSLFVNPMQFGPAEDFEKYPRDIQRDAQLATGAGVDILWCPEPGDMCPADFSTYVEETDLSRVLCGASRPGHFRGVATVVLKLLNVVRPHRAYFGMKDYQQALIVRRMCRDLNLDVEIVQCPTVREEDGLAMSSRNMYLNSRERAAALCLSRALADAKLKVDRGERDTQRLRNDIVQSLRGEPLIDVEYVEFRDAESLKSVDLVEWPTVIAVAARVGSTRLIDNVVVMNETCSDWYSPA
ncbi:MAG: pantoate--beta-alanine ligase [Armatimonadetes bacterium CG2_30_59_28]|nr:pantoate--beta-alanine ligase [Armatimonadota bacterium]OIO96854.1 MAG: pantoate--beta-alanine ligase [Armatimonadetes bacterium CG2_30_59_28]PIU60564.1 MAG: pantoate--beta-alanine ligase [Armatimonadetes bacterium CG07_land_8_20_14_0_80_59_28]PIX44716.1 MAG: pantoate--beta-alanine ligase [Armatimonadetes bacterium CG_4_8_14_3_um_filter_58_9]PIY48138.1 MAG: pantoate--beta-alanine ligase [Armatimonadetes bacterium CG_4_10_14_3_um_filter_59_10]